jgi:hypothetical protein
MTIDDDIRAVEERIARGRNGLAALAEDCEETARDVVASPKSLLAVAAVGFVLGEALHGSPRSARGRKAGWAGMLLGAGVALLRARYGNPWSLVELVLSRAAERDRARAGPLYPRSPAAPPADDERLKGARGV